MSTSNENTDFNRKDSFSNWVTLMFITPVVSYAAMVVIGISDVAGFTALGAWGDFVGGVMNPVLSAFTLGGVLITIYLQRDELALTRKEMARSASALEEQSRAITKQNFDSTFFEMLKTLNLIINSIDLVREDGSTISTGRDCFRSYYTRFNKIYREKTKSVALREDVLHTAYSAFWKEAQLDLGHYYRFLYRFFKFIETTGDHSEFYSRLLRSQLSDQELLLLFYNCTQERGQRFREIAVRHALFDNMPTVRLLSQQHQSLIDAQAFGDNPMTRPHDMSAREVYRRATKGAGDRRQRSKSSAGTDPAT